MKRNKGRMRSKSRRNKPEIPCKVLAREGKMPHAVIADFLLDRLTVVQRKRLLSHFQEENCEFCQVAGNEWMQRMWRLSSAILPMP